jgi:hypothetical protein
MQRIATDTKAADLFGAGKHGFTAGDPILGVLATNFSPAWANGLQEETARLIEWAGSALDPAKYDQAKAALSQAFGGASRTVAADTVLTHADAGLVLIDAAAGPVSVTLPAADRPCAFRFVRIDASANAVSVQRAGTDLIDGASSFGLWRQNGVRGVMRATEGVWRAFSGETEPLGGIAQIHAGELAATVTTNSGTVPTGLQLVVNKRRGSNTVTWLQVLMMQLEGIGGTGASLSGNNLLEWSVDGVVWGSMAAAIASQCIVAGSGATGGRVVFAVRRLWFDAGLPAAQQVRCSISAAGTRVVTCTHSALLGIEQWT